MMRPRSWMGPDSLLPRSTMLPASVSPSTAALKMAWQHADGAHAGGQGLLTCMSLGSMIMGVQCRRQSTHKLEVRLFPGAG